MPRKNIFSPHYNYAFYCGIHIKHIVIGEKDGYSDKLDEKVGNTFNAKGDGGVGNADGISGIREDFRKTKYLEKIKSMF